MDRETKDRFRQYYISKKGCWLPNELKQDRDFMLSIIEYESNGINDTDPILLTDKNFIVKLIEFGISVDTYINDTLKNDIDIIQAKENLDYLNIKDITLIPKDLLNQKEFIINFFKKNKSKELFIYLPSSLKIDKDICLQAIDCGLRIKEYPELLQPLLNYLDKKELLNKILTLNPEVIRKSNLRYDKKYVIEKIKNGSLIYSHLPGKIKKDKEIMELAIEKDNNAFSFVLIGENDLNFFNMSSFEEEDSELDDILLEKLFDDFIEIDNKLLFVKAIEKNCEAYNYGTEDLRNDPEILARLPRDKITKRHYGFIMSYYDTIEDIGLILECLKLNKDAIFFFSESLLTKGDVKDFIQSNLHLYDENKLQKLIDNTEGLQSIYDNKCKNKISLVT